MAWESRRSSWRAVSTGCVEDRVSWRLRGVLLGVVSISLASLVGSVEVFPAGLQQDKPGRDAAGASGSAQAEGVKAEETLISPNDLLFIQVFDVEQMSREYRVSGTGTVDFPLLPEPVQVSGMTTQQAAEAIGEQCKKAGVLTRPQITITIRESRVHSVAVTGSVKNPQLYPVFGRISLMDLLTQAGGVADDAGSTVVITRGEVSRRIFADEKAGAGQAADGQAVPSTVTVNLQRLLAATDPSLNIDVYPGDQVAVPRAGIVYVLGAVNKAGGYLLSEARQDMTVLKAVALAGYLAPFAKAKKTLLLHPDPSAPSGREDIPIDLTAMLKGHISDRPMFNNDILFIPDSTAMKALHRSADVAATTAGWAVLYH